MDMIQRIRYTHHVARKVNNHSALTYDELP